MFCFERSTDKLNGPPVAPGRRIGTTMDDLIKAKRNAILRLARQHGVSRVRVFGSMSRGEARADSDVDLLVELDEGASGFSLGALQMDLQDLLERRVEIVTEPALHPMIRERVLAEAIPL